MDYLHQEPHHENIKQKSWFKRMKQGAIELSHDSRDKVVDAQHTIKNYSDTAIQKIVDRPLPYLIMASALGFILSSMLRHK